MAILDGPPRYRSYLLAFWEERHREPHGQEVWRFSLQDPRTGERRRFASLEALVAALEREMEESAPLISDDS
ncbi:MAG: hypothetical protein JXA74_05145 [Anaerolineae bacterium]|nr:hypothetical protein [Anaerolineae bacterium]